jgi:hypothetical protein
VLVASPLTLVVKENEVVGDPSHLGHCVSPPAEKGEDLRVNGLIEYGEIVVWDQGDEAWDWEDGVCPFPLGVYSPDMHLDWAKDGEEDEVPLLAILDASVSEVEFHRESMVARQKTKGRRVVEFEKLHYLWR